MGLFGFFLCGLPLGLAAFLLDQATLCKMIDAPAYAVVSLASSSDFLGWKEKLRDLCYCRLRVCFEEIKNLLLVWSQSFTIQDKTPLKKGRDLGFCQYFPLLLCYARSHEAPALVYPSDY